MWLPSLICFRCAPGSGARSARRRSRHQPASTRLTVEALEDRRLLASGAILGTVFEDLTGNGISPDDPTIAQRGVTLFRDNGDGTLNAATDIQVARDQSRKDGRYEFRQLSAGTYFVQQDLPLGWADLEAEVQTNGMYNEAIHLSDEANDAATRDLLESIVKEEDGHVDWLEEQLDQVAQLGVPLYLSVQTRA